MAASKILGRDQSFARAVNNDLVIRALRENDLSATDLAKKLNLSNAAMTSILRNLVNDGLIKDGTGHQPVHPVTEKEKK